MLRRGRKAPQERTRVRRRQSSKPAKRATGAASGRPTGRRAEIIANAAKGILSPVPDFSAEPHQRFRGKLADIVKLVGAGDVAALKAIETKTYSSSPKAVARYRNLAAAAIEARGDNRLT